MTDGTGIGFVLELKDGSICWFFDYEIDRPFQDDAETITSFKPSNNNNSSDTNEFFFLNKKISSPRINVKDKTYFLNPLNFLSWLLFSLKDTI